MVQYTRDGPELVGLTSFGGEVVSKQCERGYPGGFADVAALRSFLTQPHPVLAPRPTGEPTIIGTKAAGSTLTCQQAKWAGHAPTSVQYTWDENKIGSDGFEFYVPIDGVPDSPSLAVTPDLATHKLLCVLDAGTDAGTSAVGRGAWGSLDDHPQCLGVIEEPVPSFVGGPYRGLRHSAEIRPSLFEVSAGLESGQLLGQRGVRQRHRVPQEGELTPVHRGQYGHDRQSGRVRQQPVQARCLARLRCGCHRCSRR